MFYLVIDVCELIDWLSDALNTVIATIQADTLTNFEIEDLFEIVFQIPHTFGEEHEIDDLCAGLDVAISPDALVLQRSAPVSDLHSSRSRIRRYEDFSFCDSDQFLLATLALGCVSETHVALIREDESGFERDLHDLLQKKGAFAPPGHLPQWVVDVARSGQVEVLHLSCDEAAAGDS
jgi:hypothetical protein